MMDSIVAWHARFARSGSFRPREVTPIARTRASLPSVFQYRKR
jgi:hypothetical protein